MSFDIETKKNVDIVFFLNQIDNHQNKEDIISMFLKGPPEDLGFMWCEKTGGPDCHWTEKEAEGLKYVGNLVLDKGWDSSGYGFMMRFIQTKIKEKYQHEVLNPEEDDHNLHNQLPVATAIPVVTTSVYSIVPHVEPPGTYLGRQYFQPPVGWSEIENTTVESNTSVEIPVITRQFTQLPLDQSQK